MAKESCGGILSGGGGCEGLRVCPIRFRIPENPIYIYFKVATQGIITEWNASTKTGKRCDAYTYQGLGFPILGMSTDFNWICAIISSIHDRSGDLSCWKCDFEDDQSRHWWKEKFLLNLTKK